MANAPFMIAGSAKLQIEALPTSELRALKQLFQGDRALRESRPLSGGSFVARLGDRRVLWRRDLDGRPIVLSIVDHSYATSA